MMIENILHAEKLEWQGHQEDIVRRIASLQDMEPVTQEDPPGIEELPEKGGAVLPQIPHRAIAFTGHGMAIDMHPIDQFVAPLVAFAARAQNGYLVALLEERAGFLPDPRVERDRKILDDDQDFPFHGFDFWRLE